ncbi:small membrane A-kinase anchor protein [Onychomys torridus]|uniref:small membrane A-kinase anchor protein n=1 Tax=Onychomys torridus TaxID=38674 RepID=UPI00167FC8A4|nr:small membrane A-kinase anchor protein [Onychomys torridus]XP_036028834.1 small membrane A-kinase anchor protein [Onychomys torridus]
MGCMKSKQTFPFPTTLDIDRLNESEEAFMPDGSCQHRTPSPDKTQAEGEVKKFPEPSPMVLEFAERLAKEIVQDALQQWACENIKYYNIPYIESEGSDITTG